ncbi:putative beta-glycosyltransferase Glycosyltransferase family 2 [Flavobacterium daejeonense]|nr:putative beta-glycosyltransferase Glycosyltransferase family 2 [Flavobacterium daejeonense]
MLGIIIPYYKITFFKETLQSLANQTNKQFRVYIGDDASRENPSDLLSKFKGQFDFIYHRFDENLGGISLTKQWERCIALSTNEEWIMLLGDDDVLSENVVEAFYDNLEKFDDNNFELIRLNLEVIDRNGIVIRGNSGKKYKKIETSEDLLFRIFSSKQTITASEFIFKRTLYVLHKGFVEFPLGWFSDYATWLLFAKKQGFINITEAVVQWRYSNVNISSNLFEIKTIKQKVQSLFLFLDFIKKNFRSIDDKSFKTTHLINLFVGLSFFQVLSIVFSCFKNENLSYKVSFIAEILKKRIIKKMYSFYANIRTS